MWVLRPVKELQHCQLWHNYLATLPHSSFPNQMACIGVLSKINKRKSDEQWYEESNETKSTQEKISGTAKLNMNPYQLHSIVHVKYMLILWTVISNTCFHIILDVPDKDVSMRYLNKNISCSSFLDLKFIQIYLSATTYILLREEAQSIGDQTKDYQIK
jgi:hypothetical protein